MAALHHKLGRAAIAEGFYRKAAGKCKEHIRLQRNDFRTLAIYGLLCQLNVCLNVDEAGARAERRSLRTRP
jgi:hypothetical protein